MIWRPRHLTRSQREERRLEAGRLLQAGQPTLVTISYTHMGNEADRVHPLSLREPSVVVVKVTGGVRYAP
jgi:hypothetical protein